MRGKVGLLHGIGVASMVLLGMLFLHAAIQKPVPTEIEEQQEDALSIRWESDTLVYDGTGILDLMDGVSVTDQDGLDRTGDTRAVLQGTDLQNQKRIYYTVAGTGQRLTEQGRLLVLENYQGPVLEVSPELHLMASQLNNLVAVLKEQGSLRGENGYGVDVTGQISWYREKVEEGEYRLSFTLINEFYDTVTVQSNAYISGVSDDILLTLREEQITLSQGDVFSPLAWILCAQDASGADLTEQVDVQGTVNEKVPGTYAVRYVLTSLDGAQRASKELRVTVKEVNHD